MINQTSTEARESGLFSSQYLPSTWQTWLSQAIDLVFPPSCLYCGRVDAHFCESCVQKLSRLPIAALVLDDVVPVNTVISSGYHTGLLQASVQALKYHGQAHLARPLADRLYATLQAHDAVYDMLVPVPIHAERLRKRGYNQAQVIGHVLAEQMQIPQDDHILYREHQARSQVSLNKAERLDNVKGDFIAQRTLAGERVLLLDDVKTTGATLSICAQALLTCGASVVDAITVTAAP